MAIKHTISTKAFNDVTELSHQCSQHINELYTQLNSIVTRFAQKDISAQLLKDTLSYSEHFIHIGKNFPQQLLAQLHWYKPNYPKAINHIFNITLCTYVLGRRAKWNDTALQQLMCCAISQFAWSYNFASNSKLDETETKRQIAHIKQANNRLSHLLKNAPLEIWQAGLISAYKRWLPQLALRQVSAMPNCPHSRILNTATALAHMLTQPNGNQKDGSPKVATSFANALTKIAQLLPSEAYPLLEAVCAYPGFYPAGCIVTLNTGEHVVVLTWHTSGLSGKKYQPQSKQCDQQIQHVNLAQIRTVQPPQTIDDLTIFDEWWDLEWQLHNSELSESHEHTLNPALFRMDKPPPSLISIQKQLENDDYDLNNLAEVIATEPVFAEHIRHTASQYSREQLPFSEVKHALLMQGANRANALLMEHALRVRLNQHYFPLQQFLQEYVECCKHISALLAEHSKLCPLEEASCWVSFATAGLFTHPEIKFKLARPKDFNTGATISELIPQNVKIRHQQLPKYALKLIDCWAQPATLKIAIQAIEQQSLSGNQHCKATTALISSSIILGKLLFTGNIQDIASSASKQQMTQLSQALPLLNLTTNDIPALCATAINNHPPTWPLD